MQDTYKSNRLITQEDIKKMWRANPQFRKLLKRSKTLEDARQKIRVYINECLEYLFSTECHLHTMEKVNARECARALRNITSPISEKRTGFSSLEVLWKIARGKQDEIKDEIKLGFVKEFEHLFKGLIGKSGIYDEESDIDKALAHAQGRDAAVIRSKILDKMSANIQKYIKKYPSGLKSAIVKNRKENVKRICEYFGASEADWNDYKWQLKHVVKDAEILSKLIDLTPEEEKAVRLAKEYKIPFGITPYYISLMDKDTSRKYDHAVRAQVIPPLYYVERMKMNREDRKEELDFMGEADTSPIDLVTRRYPQIAIFKPYNTCAQICVYCQRNWEIDECMSPQALCSREQMEKAIEWFRTHPRVTEVLITGGDPLVMQDELIDEILSKFAKIKHIERIRIGSRAPVVLPMRFTKNLINIMKKHNKTGKREVCLVTHFEHPYEVTPESGKACLKVKKAGLSIYNQQVFTLENCRKFETVALRKSLRSIGVDPYYTFNAKGKEETRHYRVPIARILQERKEGARLVSGLVRTDEPVFNIPKLGKNHLRALQDHKVIMIKPSGARVYEFHPWEKNITLTSSYDYEDIPIIEFLEEMEKRGEKVKDYKTIWYYF
ncbi:MAG: KamA family radical SAM protein [Armatimonadota bacterium]